MTIGEIKERLRIKEVLAHYQLEVKNGMASCPFHADKTPSMQVFEDSNSVRCYSGNCEHSNKTIDGIDFIMYKEGITKHQAIVKAKELAGVTHSSRSREYQMLPMDRLEEVFYKMKSNLRQSKSAREYSEQRALDYEKLEIGYNGRTYKGLMNCLVFPLKDKNNKIVSFYGRSIKDKLGGSGHYYLKDRQGLYPEYPKENTKTLILTESVIDASSLLQIEPISQDYSVLACYGVNGLTLEHREVIKSLKEPEEVIFMFDADEAGVRSVVRYSDFLQELHPTIRLTSVELPCKDVNEVLQLHQPEIFTDLLKQRKVIELTKENKEVFYTEEKQEDQGHQLVVSPEKERVIPSKQEITKGLSLSELNELIGQSGIIGEENTRLLLFIIASSYKTKNPLHGIVQGSSGSGKTHLISKIAELMPQEDVLKFTRITESSLYNWGEWDLVGKCMIIEDLDGLKEEALYSLRELISNQQLSSSVSIKDKKGNIKSTQKKVRGIFSSLSATTKADIYEDNISRSFILAVDESTTQSKKIIEYQNKKYAGELSKEKEKQAKEQLQDYLRNLQNIEVINPYATRLALPEEVHKIRRLNEMYQSIIRQITYLNQRERTYKEGKIYTAIEDLEQATEILFESIILKIDELDGSLRQFYERLKKYLKTKDKEFTQREIRQSLNISKSQLQRYIHHLLELDYVRQSGGHINRGLRYRIDYWDHFEKLRQRIKENLYTQIEELKK